MDTKVKRLYWQVEGEGHVYKIRLETVLNDMGASNWLRATLKSALQRDIVDSANDAAILADILGDICDKELTS
jgi:diaminopimelate decarboxylase